VTELDDIYIEQIGDGQPVVMIHGSAQGGPAGGGQQFDAQRPVAEVGYRLVLPDRPGHGRSPSRGPEDLEVEAQWVLDLLDDGVHLVGHSYGAAIALCAAGQRPGALRSLTLIEAPLFGLLPDDPGVAEISGRIAAASEIADPLGALIQFSQAAGIPRDLLEPAPNLEQLTAMGRGLQEMRPPDTWDPTDSLDRVADANVPVLIVTGGWSPGMEAVGDELARHLDGTRLSIDAGHHFPHAMREADGSRGRRFNEALLALMGPRGDG
jgi:pimeloyl-ACP methyl ester carboxylesterase